MWTKDSFGVAIGTVAVLMVASRISWSLTLALGSLSPVAVGLALLLLARPLARLVYGRD